VGHHRGQHHPVDLAIEHRVEQVALQMRVTAGLAHEHHVAARTAASIAPRIISPAS
jgi:hypothetical protein